VAVEKALAIGATPLKVVEAAAGSPAAIGPMSRDAPHLR